MTTDASDGAALSREPHRSSFPTPAATTTTCEDLPAVSLPQVFDNPVSPGQEAASVLQARTRRPAHEEPGSRRQDTLNSQPPALMAAALDLVAPFLTRLVSRG
jgi:hypothetical protein